MWPGKLNMSHSLELRGVSSFDRYEHDECSFTETKRTVLEGQLAQRIRRRFGLPVTGQVWLKERNWQGGTDYTRDYSTEFVVGCASAEVVFYPDSSDVWWNPAQKHDSVYFRFNSWLEAAHSDARMWREWMDESGREANEYFVSIPIHLASSLGNAATSHGRSRLGKVYLWGKRDQNSAAPSWLWELHTIAEQGFPRPQFGDAFYPRVATLRMDEPTRTAATTATDRRRILMWATNRLMPGRPHV